MTKVFESFRDCGLKSPTVICLGNFDGIHRGHQFILKTTLREAQTLGCSSIVFTFDLHPRKFFRSERNEPKLLMTYHEKIELLRAMGFDVIINQKFDSEFAHLPAEFFAKEILEIELRAKTIVVGREFTFGHQAKGNVSLLNQQSYKTIECKDQLVDKQSISSTLIRGLIAKGKLSEANLYLGYPYFLTGEVKEGDHRGESIGFPTANLKCEKECLPAYGVYASLYEDLPTQKMFLSVTNIGNRPSFSAGFSIESHLIDFNDDLSGRAARVFLFHEIRQERKFSSAHALAEQIKKDISAVRKFFQSLQIIQGEGSTTQWSLKQPNAALQSYKAFKFI